MTSSIGGIIFQIINTRKSWHFDSIKNKKYNPLNIKYIIGLFKVQKCKDQILLNLYSTMSPVDSVMEFKKLFLAKILKTPNLNLNW